MSAKTGARERGFVCYGVERDAHGEDVCCVKWFFVLSGSLCLKPRSRACSAPLPVPTTSGGAVHELDVSHSEGSWVNHDARNHTLLCILRDETRLRRTSARRGVREIGPKLTKPIFHTHTPRRRRAGARPAAVGPPGRRGGVGGGGAGGRGRGAARRLQLQSRNLDSADDPPPSRGAAARASRTIRAATPPRGPRAQSVAATTPPAACDPAGACVATRATATRRASTRTGSTATRKSARRLLAGAARSSTTRTRRPRRRRKRRSWRARRRACPRTRSASSAGARSRARAS